MKYNVTIYYEDWENFDVEADSEEDAQEVAKQMYINGATFWDNCFHFEIESADEEGEEI